MSLSPPRLAGTRHVLMAAMLTLAFIPARATDVLAIIDRSPHGLWRLVLDTPAGGAAACKGTIEVERKGIVEAHLTSPGDKFDILNDTPYLLVFKRTDAGEFVQQFSLQDSRKKSQSFTAVVESARGRGAVRTIRIRPAKLPSGEAPGAAYVAAMQATFRYDLDSYFLEILKDYMP